MSTDPSSHAQPHPPLHPGQAAWDSPRRVAWWLLGVTLLALALRLAALDRLLPVHPEPDASLVWVLRAMAGQTVENLALHEDIYPKFVAQLASLSLWWSPLAPAAPDAPLVEHLAAASAPYLKLRAVAAALGVLAVPLTYLLARSWLSKRGALFAATLLATSLLHVTQSTVSKPHVPAATFIALSLICVLRQTLTPSLFWTLCSTLAALLATSTLQSGLFVLGPLVISAWLLRRAPLAPRLAAWVAPLVVALVGPGALLSKLSLDPSGVTMGSGHVIEYGALNGGGLRAWTRQFFECDPGLALLCAAGLLVGLAALPAALRTPARRASLLLVLAFAAPYAALISLDSRVNERYLLPLYPLAAVLAAGSLAALSERPNAARVWRAAPIALLALASAAALRFAWIATRPDTFEQLSAWLEQQPQEVERRLNMTPSIAPRLAPTAESVQRQLTTPHGSSQPWFVYLGQLSEPPTGAPAWEMRALPLSLMGRDTTPEDIVDHFTRRPPGLIVFEHSARALAVPGGARFLQCVRDNSDLLARFSGEDGRWAGGVQIDYQSAPKWASRALRASALGPDLEVYRWRSTSQR